MQQPFEEEFSGQADELSDLMAEGEEGFEGEGFEAEGMEAEGFEGEGFEAEGMEGDGFEAESMEAEGMEGEGFEAEGMEAEGFEGEGFEGEGFEAEGMEAEGFEAEGADALDEAFAEAMDAQDEDEFLRRLRAGARRLAQVAGPTLRRIGRRTLPIAMRLVRQAAPRVGGIAGQEIGRTVAGLLRADAMDAFADAAADYAEEDLESFTRVLGGLAGRHVVRSTMPPARRRQQPQQARALGRAVGQMTTQIAQRIVQRYGAGAMPAVTRIVREVTRQVRQQGASPQAVPRMIRRIGTRVIGSPRAVRRLARPNPAARQLRVKAGVRRPGPRQRMVGALGGPGTRRMRTVVLRGPVRIVVR